MNVADRLAAAARLLMATTVAAGEKRAGQPYEDIIATMAADMDQLFAEGREAATMAIFRLVDLTVTRAAMVTGQDRVEIVRTVCEAAVELHGPRVEGPVQP